MGPDLTTQAANGKAVHGRPGRAAWAGLGVRAAGPLLGAALLGIVLVALAYQFPVTHTVDIGGRDAAYVRGFYDPEPTGRPAMVGSDGTARWSRGASYLLFPQAGLPAQVTLRLRGWRASGPPPEVAVLSDGRALGRFRATGAWEEHTFAIAGGLAKPTDVLIELRAETAPLSADDPRQVGILLDRATYRVGPPPITPYPAQLLFGGLAGALVWLLVDGGRRATAGPHRRATHWPLPLALALLALAFLALTRAQPPYPYPLRGLLPAVCAGLAGLLAVRDGPRLAARAPWLADAAALGGASLWLGAVLLAARGHLVLSTPGVEKDFRVFALRSARLAGAWPAGAANADLDGVFRADGFYNLGYPLLLWLARPFTHDNPFLAGRLVAALSGALMLLAGWWLARRWLGRWPALVALLALAFSPLVVSYSLYLGTDMPFAAACAVALALLVGFGVQRPGASTEPPTARRPPPTAFLAGLAAGAAFLIRQPGLALLPLGWLAIVLLRPPGARLRPALLFGAAFLLAALPQLAVNIRDTGQPLFNQQAKNVWLAVYGGGDWGRWGEASNDIGLLGVAAADPGRFLANWWGNIVGFIGAGGEDTSEFGRAIQLRLLGFPANWLAIAGLLAWLALFLRRALRRAPLLAGGMAPAAILLLWLALYVAVVAVTFALPRFFLPSVAVYGAAAAWAVARLGALARDAAAPGAPDERAARVPLLVALLLLLLLWEKVAVGAGYVLATREAAGVGQPVATLEAARLVQAVLRPGERLAIRAPRGDDDALALAKYSAIAHLVVPLTLDAPDAPRQAGASYLLQPSPTGPPPGAAPAGQAGGYTLYRLAP